MVANDPLRSPKHILKEEKKLDGSLRDIFKIKRHFHNLLIMLYIWAATSFGAYLLIYAMKDMPGNFFKNQLTVGIIDIPIIIVAGSAYHKFGARITFAVSYFVGIVGSVCILFSEYFDPNLISLFLSFAKGSMKAAIDVCYLSNSLIFPAIFSGTAFGICSASAKITTIFAPMLAEVQMPVPIIIFCAIVSVAFFASLFIKEEKGLLSTKIS